MRIIKMPAGERPRRERDGEGPGRKPFLQFRRRKGALEAKRRAYDAGEEARTTIRIIKMPSGERPRREHDGEDPGLKRASLKSLGHSWR